MPTLLFCNITHLDFVDGLPLLQILAPHRDPQLAVPQTPALLAQTLRLEAGKCPVVRDGHSLSRHGSLPRRREREKKKREGEGGERGGLLIETPVGPWRRRDEPAGGKEGKEAESTATLVRLLPWR